MPIPIDQLVQLYLDWLHQSTANQLLGTLVVHLGTPLANAPAEGSIDIAANYDQVVVAEGIAKQGQNATTIAGSDWSTFTAHDSFVTNPKFKYNVTVNKAGVLTTQPTLNGKPVGGSPPTVHHVAAESTGTVITVIEDGITYTLSFRKFIQHMPQ